MLPVDWFIGIPLNDSTIRIEIAEVAQEVLGDKLIGMQVGNEPDLYARHGERPEVRDFLGCEREAEVTHVESNLSGFS